MGNPDASWSCERDGKLCQEPNISFDAGKLRTGLEVIANQLGKKLDEDNPRLHAQLPDGSRIAACDSAARESRSGTDNTESSPAAITRSMI